MREREREFLNRWEKSKKKKGDEWLDEMSKLDGK